MPCVVVTGCWAQTDPDAVARARRGGPRSWATQEKYRLPELAGESARGRGRGARRAAVHVARHRQARGPGALRALRARDRPLARLRQGPGRLPAPLRLLHRARRARGQPQPGPRGGARAGARGSSRPATGRSRSPAWISVTTARIWCRGPAWPRSLRAPRRGAAGSAGCGCPRCCPRTSRAELVEVVTGLAVVAPHLHVPLQSGSDRVLRLMRRPYNVADVPGPRRAARAAPSPISGSAPT